MDKKTVEVLHKEAGQYLALADARNFEFRELHTQVYADAWFDVCVWLRARMEEIDE